MKHSILFCLSILFSGILFSQDVGIGIRGGYDYSTASVQDIFTSSDSDRRQIGASGSFFIDWKINKKFSIETHVQWAQRETFPVIDSLINITTITTNDTTIFNTSLISITESAVISNVIEFPVLAKFQFGSDILKVFVFGGPNFSFINSKFEEVRVIKKGEDDNITKTDLSKDSFDSYEYSNLAGFGIRLKFNRIVISADYRYKFQFRDADQIRLNGITKSLGSNVGIGLGYYW